MSDPTAGHHRQGLTKHDLKYRDWNDQPPPRNPLLVARQQGRQHVNQATGTTLFKQSAMPLGDHADMPMERVPKEALRGYWLHRVPLVKQWPHWAPVIDYIERHLHEIEA
jgi:hypothetical protein